MSVKRMWTLGAVFAVVLVFGLAAALGVQPRLAAAETADATRTQVETQNQTVQLTIARLSRAAAKQSELEATAQRLAEAVPSAFGLNTFSRMLRETAALDGVRMESLSPGDAVPYVLPAKAEGPRTFWGRTNAAITPENLSVIPVTVSVTGATDAVLRFASDAQRMDAVFAVDQGGTTDAAGGGTTLTLSGSIFALNR